MNDEASRARKGSTVWNWLLLIPFIALLWVPFYNSAEPSWEGIPFFYWYQMLWLILTAVITAVVYVLSGER